jgi:hypothetical protein
LAVALGLDDDLASHDRSRVVGDAVDTAVAGGSGLAGVQAHGEQVLDQRLEVGGLSASRMGRSSNPPITRAPAGPGELDARSLVAKGTSCCLYFYTSST